jgi:uncharacterized membrane protein/predicted GH43/DUF377 family glycosyl hydrolase
MYDAPVTSESILGLTPQKEKTGLWESVMSGTVSEPALVSSFPVPTELVSPPVEPVPRGTGGPDAFGYTWVDSKAPAPQVNYSWIEISGTGTNSGLAGDDSFTSAAIGFSFSFYENTYTTAYFSTNGIVTFGAGSSSYSNTVLPTANAPNNMLAAFWDDLDSNGGTAYYQTLGSAPNRLFVIEWLNWWTLGGQGPMTFEVVLFESGEILFQYNSLGTATGGSASVGIENSAGSIGLQYSYNSATALQNGMAILFACGPLQYDFDISPPNQTNYGFAGGTVDHILTMDNRGTEDDTCDLSTTQEIFNGQSWAKQGMVMDYGGTYESQTVYSPSVILDNGTYRMWYNGYDGINTRIMRATSPDGVSWTKQGLVINHDPVNNSQNPGDPCVLKIGGEYKMWYGTYNGAANQVAFASSTDGVTWTKHGVVLAAGWAGELHAALPTVIYDDGIYKMWYSNYVTMYHTNYATSLDGINWTKHGQVLAAGETYAEAGIYGPDVQRLNGHYHMWYSGKSSGGSVRILYADSPDGIAWTRHGVALTYGPIYETHSVDRPCTLLDGGTLKMWYSGYEWTTPAHTRIMYATSPFTLIEPAWPVTFRNLADTTDITQISAVSGSNTSFIARVSIPPMAIPGEYDNATVFVTSMGNPGNQRMAGIRTEAVIMSNYSVSLLPAFQSGMGTPNNDSFYTLTIRNEGLYVDTYDLAYAPGFENWGVNFYNLNMTQIPAIGPIPPDSSESFIVCHSVSAGAGPGDLDAPDIYVFSQNDPMVYASARVQTMVEPLGPEPILLVDDDQGLSTELWFMDSLNSLGYGFEYWDTTFFGTPNSSVMAIHDIVIWMTGDRSGGSETPGVAGDTLSPAERLEIETYLGMGGRLYMSSGGLGWDGAFNGWGAWIGQYLGATAWNGGSGTPYSLIGVDSDTIGDSLAMTIHQGDYCSQLSGLWTWNDPTDAQTSASILWNPDLANALLKRDDGNSRTAYTAFDLADVGGVSNRTLLLDRIIFWLMNGDVVPDFRCNLEPEFQTGIGFPNGLINYTLSIENTGNLVDTYVLSYMNTNLPWPVMFLDQYWNPVTSIGPVGPGNITFFTVCVTIPFGTIAGDFDIAEITATSLSDGSVSDTVLIQTTVPAELPWFDDMESGNTGWQPGTSGSTVWELGDPSGFGPGMAYSPSNCWGTNIAANYGDGSDVSLVSPPLDITNVSNLELTFQMWFGSESIADAAWVEASSDGTTWFVINPLKGPAYASTIWGMGYTGPIGGWHEAMFDLSSYAGGMLWLRFRFMTDGSVTDAGWYVDDVQVSQPPSYRCEVGPEFSHDYGYPNGTVDYHLNVRNTGIEDDIYNISTMVNDWPVSFLLAEPQPVINNPGFELGDFSWWNTQDLTMPFLPLQVTGAGVSPGFGLFSTAPTEGSLAAVTGWDGNGPGTIVLSQDVILPSSNSMVTFDYRAGWDLAMIPATVDRTFSVAVQPFGGGSPWHFETLLVAPAGTFMADTGDLFGTVDMSPFAGMPVRICFEWYVPESNSGPAFFQIDNVRISELVPVSSFMVEAGEAATVIARVSIPPGASPGDYDFAAILVESTSDASVFGELFIQTHVPYLTDWFDGFETWMPWISDVVANSNPPTFWDMGNPMGSGPGSAYNGSNCVGTNIWDAYYPGADIAFATPYIELGSGRQELTFQHWYQTNDWGFAVDGGFVEINDGIGWVQIYPTDGYPNDGYLGGYNTQGYSGDSSGWVREVFDISAWSGQVVQVRFHFAAADGWQWGWYIDDVFMGSPPPYRCELTPEFQSHSGLNGTEIIHTLILNNTGSNVDAYNLFYSGVWPGIIYDTGMNPINATVPIQAGNSAIFYVGVTVPPGALLDENDTATVFASSQGEPSSWDTAMVQTRCGMPAPSVLILHADDNAGEPLRSQLLAFGQLDVVDVFDARSATPTLTQLLSYDVVITWCQYSYFDTIGTGNVLADYVDNGGRVITLMFSMGTHGWRMQGRFVNEGYLAMNGGDVEYTTANLGVYDPFHPIMDGVTGVQDMYRLADSYLTADSHEVARWSDGELFVAAKDDKSVVSIAGYAGYYRQWSGQMDLVIHNAIFWLNEPPAPYACSLTPSYMSSNGDPGDYIYYTLTVQNIGLNEDSYYLSCWNTVLSWDLAIYDMSWNPVWDIGPISPGGTANFILEVAIPSDAQVGDYDITEIYIESMNDFTSWDWAQTLTTVLHVPTNVAIFQTQDPWGITATRDILTAWGIPYTIFGPSDIGVVDLSIYDKAIFVGSDGQDVSLYQAMAANEGWFEDYVESGGVLNIMAADWGLFNDMPFDLESSSSPGDSVDIVAPGHLLLTTPNVISDGELDSWGSSFHRFFTGYPSWSSSVLTGNFMPVLLEFQWGNGRVIATGQPVEWAWASGASMLLENLILAMDGTSTLPPWSFNLSPDYQSASASPGDFVDYTLTISNLGTMEDSYDIGYANWVELWPVTFYDMAMNPVTQVGSVAAGDSISFIARVSVPSGATMGQYDLTEVFVMSYWTGATDSVIIETEISLIVSVPWFDDMESGALGWGAEGLWHIVWDDVSPYPNSHSPVTSWWYGQDMTGDYSTGARTFGRLETPWIDLTSVTDAELTFWEWYETEGGYPMWDQRIVQVNTGSGWSDIVLLDESAMSTWQERVIDLTPYCGGIVKMGFFFDTLDSFVNEYRGWYIDDFSVESTIDLDPPEHSNEYPFDGQIINDPAPTIMVDVTDATGVDLSTVRLYVNGFNVFSDKTAISGGYHVQYAHEGIFTDGEIVTCRIVARDVLGYLMDWTWTFTVDLSSPVVLWVSPPDGAGGVPLDSVIDVCFSEPMDEISAMLAFTLSPSTSGTLSWNGSVMTFTPDIPLTFDTMYTAGFIVGAHDIAGNPLGNFTWSFSTGDIIPPEHSNESPAIDGWAPDLDPTISVDVTDMYGIDMSTIRLYIQGFRVDCSMTPIPDGYAVSYWHEAGFMLGQTVTCRIVAMDIYGNLLDFTWHFIVMPSETFDIDIHYGWNLISLPLVQADTSVPAVLASIEGQWDMVKYYDAGDFMDPWKSFRINGTANDLAEIDHTIGFWLHALANTTLTVYGTVPTATDIQLLAGWNLVGYPTLNINTTVADALFGTGYDRIEIYDAGAIGMISEINGSYVMMPGEGYWVHVPGDAVWAVSWAAPPLNDVTALGDNAPESSGAPLTPRTDEDSSLMGILHREVPALGNASSDGLTVFGLVMLVAAVMLVSRRRFR